MTGEAARLFVVTVAMTAEGQRSGLLVLASVLHRRGIDVVEADMARPAHGRRVFSAAFHATERQATTVLRSLQNLIDVVDATLFEAFDARHGPAAADACQPRVPAVASGR